MEDPLVDFSPAAFNCTKNEERVDAWRFQYIPSDVVHACGKLTFYICQIYLEYNTSTSCSEHFLQPL